MWLVAGIAVAVWLLWKGADWVVESAAVLARRAGISQLVVGMTIVALGTSAPELVVTLAAAFDGHPDVSVANVVGSNICNTGLILGLCAALYCVPTSRATVLRDVPVLLGASCLLLVFLMDGTLTHVEGLTLLGLLGIYLTYLFCFARGDSETSTVPDDPETKAGALAGRLGLGLVGLVLGGQLLVESATGLADRAGFSDWVIGLTVVASGTSLPELATALLAARRGHAGIVIGNLVGSDIFNVLGVLGVAASLRTLDVEPAARVGLTIMVASVAVLVLLMRTGWRLSRVEGYLIVGVALWRWGRDLIPGAW